ncbi:MAG: hypothetical protein ACH6QJ_00805 [Candidatus Carsonella ruddii]
MYKILLSSSGKDSTFSLFFYNFINIFIYINNCKNYVDKKYIFLIGKNFKKSIILINLTKEYIFYFNDNFKNINVDYYCNKFIKIYLLKIFFLKKIILTGHYFLKIRKFFVSSIDCKKDQIFFLNFNNNFLSILGYYNKIYINFICFKNNFICKKKKSTKGICFNIIKKKIINFIINNNNMFINLLNNNNYYNLGKKIFNKKIIKIKNNFIIISNYVFFYKYKYLLINFYLLNKNIKIKINSQSLKKYIKIIKINNKSIIILYKNQKFIEKNILILYNELAIFNSKIIKKY